MSQFGYDDEDASSSLGQVPVASRSPMSCASGGLRVVVLEAGPRLTAADFHNDEWATFGQMPWVDPRTTSGMWRISKDFPNLPAWIVKAVGGTMTHWALAHASSHTDSMRGPRTATSTTRTCWTGRSTWPRSDRTMSAPKLSWV